jgi:hypothetical protein
MMRHASAKRPNVLARWWSRRSPFDQLMFMVVGAGIVAPNLLVLSILLTLHALFPHR